MKLSALVLGLATACTAAHAAPDFAFSSKSGTLGRGGVAGSWGLAPPGVVKRQPIVTDASSTAVAVTTTTTTTTTTAGPAQPADDPQRPLLGSGAPAPEVRAPTPADLRTDTFPLDNAAPADAHGAGQQEGMGSGTHALVGEPSPFPAPAPVVTQGPTAITRRPARRTTPAKEPANTFVATAAAGAAPAPEFEAPTPADLRESGDGAIPDGARADPHGAGKGFRGTVHGPSPSPAPAPSVTVGVARPVPPVPGRAHDAITASKSGESSSGGGSSGGSSSTTAAMPVRTADDFLALYEKHDDMCCARDPDEESKQWKIGSSSDESGDAAANAAFAVDCATMCAKQAADGEACEAFAIEQGDDGRNRCYFWFGTAGCAAEADMAPANACTTFTRVDAGDAKMTTGSVGDDTAASATAPTPAAPAPAGRPVVGPGEGHDGSALSPAPELWSPTPADLRDATESGPAGTAALAHQDGPSEFVGAPGPAPVPAPAPVTPGTAGRPRLRPTSSSAGGLGGNDNDNDNEGGATTRRSVDTRWPEEATRQGGGVRGFRRTTRRPGAESGQEDGGRGQGEAVPAVAYEQYFAVDTVSSCSYGEEDEATGHFSNVVYADDDRRYYRHAKGFEPASEADCAAACAGARGCAFFWFEDTLPDADLTASGRFCILHPACDELRTPGWPGTTFVLLAQEEEATTSAVTEARRGSEEKGGKRDGADDDAGGADDDAGGADDEAGGADDDADASRAGADADADNALQRIFADNRSGECPGTCLGHSCMFWLRQDGGVYTCTSLEQAGCDCSGCSGC